MYCIFLFSIFLHFYFAAAILNITPEWVKKWVKRQPTVALSTCEAEYMVLAATVQGSMYLVRLLNGVDGSHYIKPKVHEDNQDAIA